MKYPSSGTVWDSLISDPLSSFMVGVSPNSDSSEGVERIWDGYIRSLLNLAINSAVSSSKLIGTT